MSPSQDDTPLGKQSKGCSIYLKRDAERTNKLNSKVQVIEAFHRETLTELALLGLGHGLPAPGPLEFKKRNKLLAHTHTHTHLLKPK